MHHIVVHVMSKTQSRADDSREEDMRCIDCGSADLDIHAFVAGGIPVIELTCIDCGITRTLAEADDE